MKNEMDAGRGPRVRAVETFAMWGGLRNWVFVRVTAEDGLYGWGEATVEGKEATVQAAIQELGQALLGRDALATETNWQLLFRHGFWRGGVILNSALAALDQALWDIRGKVFGAPVYRLLGGPTRARVRLYTHVGIYDPARLEHEAEEAVEAGFTAVKTGAWAGDAALAEAEMVAACAERIARLRQVVGARCDIFFDNHGRSRPDQAIRLLQALAPYRLGWFEEPTMPEDPDALAPVCAVARTLGISIAAGERLYSRWEARPFLERRLLDILQPDLCHAGGLTECLKLAALADTYEVMLAPHSPQGPVSTAAAAHLALAIPNFLILEYLPALPYRAQVLREPWPVVEGALIVPDRPGLGVDLDEAAIAANPPREVGVPRAAWTADGAVADV